MRRQPHPTIRNLAADAATELERHERKSNGLAALGGKWTEEEFAAFERSVQELGEQPGEVRSERSHIR